ncbi:hypothetical protein [Flavobacterium oreochromis]|uniref:Membrane or secreted protein n=1 Tax=Flavobacterium oreochromis TaxID=2906078 RepID=A0ABW8PBE9_9FLAO|nr:hypothetical protein [Flavobacterium oreochromis]OWP76514.1 hypothetical protein BWG23_07925 [Flavobacterium oreochromis]POR26998.1 hypothetical protein BWK58_04775 [Flavobacterium columnare]
MKKKIILIVLLVFPIVIYLIFASATHNQLFLPTISKNNLDLPKWESLDKKPVTLINKITVLGFLGDDIKGIQGNVFNLNQKIYDKYVGFKDFQVVFLAVEGTQNEVKELFDKLAGFTENMSAYHVVFASKPAIQSYYDSFKLRGKLNNNFATSEVLILDKDINHRGRIGKNKEGVEEYRESYNTTSAADLHNEMTDDIKILLREYRLALKRNKNKENFHLHEKK